MRFREFSLTTAVLLMTASGCSAPETLQEERTAHVAEATTNASQICARGAKQGDATKCGNPGAINAATAAAVWSAELATHPTQPVQMWVSPPDDNMDQFVANKAELDAWFASIQTVIAFLQSSSANAEALDASLNGYIGTWLKTVKTEQDKLIAGAPADPKPDIDAFENALRNSADAAAAPVGAAIAFDKQSGAAVTGIVQAAKTAVAAYQQPFAAMLARYNAYRGTESTELANYTKFAKDGASATIASMPSVQDEILSFNRTQSPTPDQLMIDASRLRMTIAAAGATYAAQLDPYTDFMNRMGMARPDLTSTAVRALDNMTAYVQRRRERNDSVATRLLDELALRRKALLLIAGGQASQAATAQAELLAASTNFLNNATSQISALWAAPPTSTKLKLPYLAVRYDAFTAFLQLQSLCSVGATGTWREAGCNSLNAQFSKAQSYLQTTLPGQIKIGAMLLTGKPGVTAAVLADLQSKLKVGNIKGAAAEYDAAVQASDG